MENICIYDWYSETLTHTNKCLICYRKCVYCECGIGRPVDHRFGNTGICGCDPVRSRSLAICLQVSVVFSCVIIYGNSTYTSIDGSWKLLEIMLLHQSSNNTCTNGYDSGLLDNKWNSIRNAICNGYRIWLLYKKVSSLKICSACY